MNPEFAAVVLAGGESSRFRETRPEGITEDKLLAELVEGKTAVDLTLEQLNGFGVPKGQTVIVTSPKKLGAFMRRYPGYKVVLQEEPLGNADAASKSIEEISGFARAKTVILVQGDDSFTYSSDDYRQMVDCLLGTEASAVVMVLNPERAWSGSTKTFWHIGVDKDNVVHEVEKGSISDDEESGGSKLRYLALVNAFAIKKTEFMRNIFGLVPNPDEKNEVILPDFIKQVVKNGGRIIAIPTDKFMGFNDFGQYMLARQELQAR